MLVALCAATPEISSAVTALMLKQHDVGVGIIIGSNIFNLEALLGVSALIAGRLQIKRQALVFNRFSSSPMMRNWRISLKTIYSEMCK
jgi:cation:H+ antiporter